MSDAFYNELLVDVNEVINEYGKSFQVRSAGGFDTQTLETAQGLTRTVMGIVADSSLTHTLSTVVQRDQPIDWLNKKMLILASTLKPLKGDEINVDGVWLSLSKIQAIKPANVALLYMLELSR